MEVSFTPEREAQLHELAVRTGRKEFQLVEEAVEQFLRYDASFIKAVEQGRASARRGELLEHDEVVERVERMFRS